MTTEQDMPPGDEFKIRCRKLGHQIEFSYCRVENDGLPCTKILDCWYSHFPVEEYLRKELSEEEWDRAFNAPNTPKMLTLVELIEQAKKKQSTST